LQKHLHAFVDTVPPPVKEALPPKKNKKQNKNNPHFHLADELQRITGVDLTRSDGVDVMVTQTVISEVGLDMSHESMENRGALRFVVGTLPRQPHQRRLYLVHLARQKLCESS
jgi:hypothetical protein